MLSPLSFIADRLPPRLLEYGCLMDLIGDAIAAMRAGEPRSARGRLAGTWGIRFRASGGIGVHIVLQGTAWLLPPDGSAPIQLSGGDVALVDRSRPHGLANDPHTPLVDAAPGQQAYWTRDVDIPDGVTPMIVVGGTYYLRNVRPHPLISSLPPVIHMHGHVGADPAVRSVVDLLGSEMATAGRPGATAAIPALLDLLLIYVLRAWYRLPSTDCGWAAALRDPGITAALAAMQDRPGEPWTVETLAREAGQSRAAFARHFGELIGQPPLAYLTWWRLTLAARYLRETPQPLAAIASRVGYTSEFAFGRAFRREFHVSPGAYRRDQPDNPTLLGSPQEPTLAG